MDQSIRASLSHTHFWYEVGMLKVSAIMLLLCCVESVQRCFFVAALMGVVTAAVVYNVNSPCLRSMLHFLFFHLTYSRWTSSLPSCLWPQRIFPSLPGSRLTTFLSRCKFSTLTTRQPMVQFYLLTFPRFPLRKKEHKSYFGKNRTHDFRTSRCAAYLLDHSVLLDFTVAAAAEELRSRRQQHANLAAAAEAALQAWRAEMTQQAAVYESG